VETPLRRMSLWGLCLLWLAGALSSCGQGAGSDPAESRPVLHYFTWSDYVGPELIQEFERREGVKVVDRYLQQQRRVVGQTPERGHGV
jgi:spermidine/putrescine-binding protein